MRPVVGLVCALLAAAAVSSAAAHLNLYLDQQEVRRLLGNNHAKEGVGTLHCST